jgi:hypothetical protein
MAADSKQKQDEEEAEETTEHEHEEEEQETEEGTEEETRKDTEEEAEKKRRPQITQIQGLQGHEEALRRKSSEDRRKTWKGKTMRAGV